MTRNCGRWILAALLLLGLDWHVLHAGVLGGMADRVAHLGLLALLGFTLARVAGRRGAALVVVAWWSAGLHWHLAFLPGREVGLNVWLPEVLAAVPGAWWAVRSGPRTVAAEVPVARVAVLSDLPR